MKPAVFRTADPLSRDSVQPEGVLPEASPPAEQSADPLWVDLTALNRTAYTTVQARYGLPPEVMTYFLLRYQSAKLIHAGPALFVVTFLAIPSALHLFTTRELKICVMPTLVATLYGLPGKTQGTLAQTLPALASPHARGTGWFLRVVLDGVIGSYEAIVRTLTARPLDGAAREEQQRWRKRAEKLIRCLRDEQVLLRNVTREGGKLLVAAESEGLAHLEARAGTLARTAWEALRPQPHQQIIRVRAVARKGGDT